MAFCHHPCAQQSSWDLLQTSMSHSSHTTQQKSRRDLNSGVVGLYWDTINSVFPSCVQKANSFQGACSPPPSLIGDFLSEGDINCAISMLMPCTHCLPPPPSDVQRGQSGGLETSLAATTAVPYLGMKDHKWWLPSNLPINKYREC